MVDQNFYRWTGFALIGAGIATAIFWLMVIPFESFAGPEVPLHPLFVPGQVFHILGAILAVFGYFGLYLKQKEPAGTLGAIGFVIAVIGMMFFLADAMIADEAPLKEVSKAMGEGEFYGMHTFDQDLLEHVREGRIGREVALATASDPHDLRLMLAAEAVDAPPPATTTPVPQVPYAASRAPGT